MNRVRRFPLLSTGFLFAGMLFLSVPANAAPDKSGAEDYCRKRFMTEIDESVGYGSSAFRPGMTMSAPPAMPEVYSAAPEMGAAASAPPPMPSVGSAPPPVGIAPPPGDARPMNRDRYPEIDANPIKIVAESPVSTFAADVDTASYALARRHLTDGLMPPTDAVRVEEFINAFSYGYAAPAKLDDAFLPEVDVFPAPWNKDRQLLRIGVKAFEVPADKRPAANLVFLLDVSGSMAAIEKLPLAKTSICMMTHELKPDDRVALVVYAGAAGVILEPTPVAEKAQILDALDRLGAGGSTAGGEGIELAYAMAEAHFLKGGINRVILATDGDFNVGVADPRHLSDFVAGKRDAGIFLTVLGFGLGNYHDTMMQSLAQNGNGVAAYIDSLEEAHKVLVRGLTSSIVTVAKDVKFQVEFNPDRVAEYRLIGYETRLLDRTEFDNDRVDAGDVGSGHAVTALYELALVGGPGLSTPPLRYGTNKAAKSGVADELAFLRIRFKAPDGGKSRLIERPVTAADVSNSVEEAPESARLAAAVAWFGQALRDSPHVPADWPSIQILVDTVRGADPFGERVELLSLILKARSIKE